MERKDCWNDSDDRKLSTIVLKHIRSGSTQLKAFEEAGEQLERTAAACGFRWNSEVRKHYENDIKEAKIMRNKNSKFQNNESENDKDNYENSAIDQLVSLASNLKATIENMSEQIKELQNLIKQKEFQISELEEKLIKHKPEETLKEDYSNFLNILKRARELGVLDRISG